MQMMMKFRPEVSFTFRHPRALVWVLGVLLYLNLTILSPQPLEEPGSSGGRPLPPERLLELDEGEWISPGLPEETIPNYRISEFVYQSATAGKKDWTIHAKTSRMFNEEDLVHGIDVISYLYDDVGKATKVTSLEAIYKTEDNQLDLWGDVVATFPDGFVVKAPYMHYEPNSRLITVPMKYRVNGFGEDFEKYNEFDSNGLIYALGPNQIVLRSQVEFRIIAKPESTSKSDLPAWTRIRSDLCEIDRQKRVAYFRMRDRNLDRPRYVRVRQPDLRVRSRQAYLDYSPYKQPIDYLVSERDVLIQELKEKDEIRYSTSGRASFDTHTDVITLTEFPQVYQGDDTVTGETIKILRKTDIVEVEQGNAFSRGNQESFDPDSEKTESNPKPRAQDASNDGPETKPNS
jgi:LPS export ABC transporter protein LptC